MKIKLAKKAGFCTGVKKAIETANKLLENEEEPIYTLGPIVHNPEVVKNLADKGIHPINDLGEIDKGIVLIRTHGVPPDKYREIANNNLKMVDATCEKVKEVQRLVSRLSKEGHQIIIVGDEDHPEVIGLKGWAGEDVLVFERENNIPFEKIKSKAAVVAQTTLIPSVFEAIQEKIKAINPDISFHNTICRATLVRQQSAREIAQESDLMVVIGGLESSNTQKLVKVCQQVGGNIYHIATAKDLDKSWLCGKEVIGVTAGASTPDWTIKEVVGKMEEVNQENEVSKNEISENEETNEGSALYEEEVKSFAAGEMIQGKIVQINEDEALVDIGYKSDGIIPREEIPVPAGESINDYLKVDETVELIVKKIDDEEDRIILSKRHLDKEKVWNDLEDALENNNTLSGKVKSAVQAGLLLEMSGGVEGFMPGSLVDTKYIPDFAEMVNKEIDFKVIELNKEKDKVILSRKKVLEEKVESKKEETLQSIEEGQIIKGEVKRLTDFGAFVDVGGIDGLIHISEISWKRIDHPQDILKVGDEVDVKVLEVIPERERIGLSIRKAQPDPWSLVEDKYSEGDIVEGTTTRLVSFGAFVELIPGVEGLVHISQLAEHHVKSANEVLEEGQNIKVKILEINTEGKRISLSVKEAAEKKPAPKVEQKYNAEENNDEGSGVTLGDVFGKLFE